MRARQDLVVVRSVPGRGNDGREEDSRVEQKKWKKKKIEEVRAVTQGLGDKCR